MDQQEINELRKELRELKIKFETLTNILASQLSIDMSTLNFIDEAALASPEVSYCPSNDDLPF
jgi:hypothetical protein